jgi:hypothetical protein
VTLYKKGVLIFLVAGLVSSVVYAGPIPPENPNVQLEPAPLYDDNNAYCLATFEDRDDSSGGELRFNWSVSGTQVKLEPFSSLANNTQKNSTLSKSSYSEGDEVLCNVTSTDSSGNKKTGSESVIADTFDPEITSGPNFFNYSSEHAFNVSAVVLDRESDDEIENCWLNASGLSGGPNIREDMNIDRTYGNGDEAQCTYSNISNISFTVLEDVNITTFANDSGSEEGNRSALNPIPNSPPRVFDVQPSTNAVISSGSVDLSARFTDQDGEKIDVDFINSTGSTNNVLGGSTDVSPGSQKTYNWDDLQQLKTYFWQLEISDDHQTVTRKFRFRVRFPSQLRVDTRFETPYNSILVSPNNSRSVRYSVFNDGTNQKNDLETTVYTADGRISSTGSMSSNPFSLQPGERKFFNIIISPDQLGKTELVVATDSSNYVLNTTERIDVYVDNRPNAAREVPGIGLTQLYIVLLVSTLYYSARL